MPRSMRFFENECPDCGSLVDIPMISDFAYGELVYQTEEGRSYAHVSAADHPAWDRVQAIFEGVFGVQMSGAKKYSARLYQRVMIRCADPHEGKRFTFHYPLCPECGKKIRNFHAEGPSFDEEIPEVTWNAFLSATEADQRAKVLGLIEELKTR